ncbi:MAG: nitroreductase family protein [Planctomycetales bacterium]|nr:nitroreductase family protein [Planctomycetales bacterium]
MDIFEAIKRRHSYRGGLKNQPIPRQDLQKIVQAGLDAPSGKNAQTTRFVIVDEPGLVGRIAQMHPVNKAMQQARAFIACVVDCQPEAIYEGMSFAVEDCAAAVENMLLAITALGYASVWIDGWLRVEGRNETIGKLLGVPSGKIIRILLPIGVPAEEYKQPPKMPFEQRAWFNQYENLQ